MVRALLITSDVAVQSLEAWARFRDTYADRRKRRGPQPE